MTEPSIICPSCKSTIKLTESLAAPLVEAERKKAAEELEVRLKERLDAERASIANAEAKKAADKFAAELDEVRVASAEKDAKLAEARQLESSLRQEREQLREQKRDLELSVERRLDQERERIRADQDRRTRDEMSRELSTALEDLTEKNKQLADAKAAEVELRREREKLGEQKRDLELSIERRVSEARDRIRTEQAERTREEMNLELAAAREDLAAKDKQLAASKAAELELRRERTKLTEEKEALDLTVAQRVDEEREKVREQTRRERDEQHRLKLAEKEKVIADMQKQLEEASRKAEQGSQQAQGDVAEADLESLLRSQFPHDDIDGIGKGREGADRIQRVLGPAGQPCGAILWERKRTKSWSNDWLEKARDDQRAARANVVVIVSDALPRHVSTFNRIEGVWVTSPACALPLAIALRQAISDTWMAHRAMEGRSEKEALVYAHVTSAEFLHRISLMVEAILSLREQHEKEKTALRRIWAEREKQFDRLMSGTASIYGGFRGIVGATLPEIAGLSLPEPLHAPSLLTVEPKSLEGTASASFIDEAPRSNESSSAA
jgi:hypothetical protein